MITTHPTPRPTLRDLVVQAVTQGDSAAAGLVADYLRDRQGMTYEQIYDFAYRITGVSVARWDALLDG